MKKKQLAMQPTNTHLDGISIGDNVWVTQGKTDHMATFLGEPRKVVVYDDSEIEGNNNSNEEEYEAMIRWATTGTTSHVKASSIRPVVLGQRRRRKVVNHYHAVPSQRPGGPTRKRKKKTKAVKQPQQQQQQQQQQNEDEGSRKHQPKEQPSLQALNNQNEHNEREKESDDAVVVAAAAAASSSSSSKSTAKEAPAKKSSRFKFKLPTREEFQKYQEQRRLNKEKKKREKESSGKGKRDQPDDDNATASNEALVPKNDSQRAATPENDSKPAAIPENDSKSAAIPENDSKQAAIPASTSNEKQQSASSPVRRRISDSDGSSVVVEQRVRKNDGDVENPSHTIDRGFRWEWETPEARDKTKDKKISDDKTSTKPLPENFCKGQPRSFAEAYSMMVKFQQINHEEEGNNKLEIPSDHPLLGKLVTDLRSEYADFRKHALDQQKRSKVEKVPYRSFDRDSLKDLTRVDRRRIRQLKSIGFRWRALSDNSSERSDVSLASESGDEEVEFGNTSSDVSSFDNDSDSDDSAGSEPKKFMGRKSSWQRSAVSAASPSSSSSSFFTSSDDEDLPINNHQEDHANDEKILIISRLDEVNLSPRSDRNRMLIASRKPTFPINLYRLLRFSAMNPKLGFNEIIRWNDDGNGFRIAHDAKFMSKIVSKISNQRKSISFRNSLGVFSFVMIEYGRDKHGCKYRVYQHKSIQEAKEANDPSLRLFYRGAPLELLWKMGTRKEDLLDKKAEAKNAAKRRKEDMEEAKNAAKRRKEGMEEAENAAKRRKEDMEVKNSSVDDTSPAQSKISHNDERPVDRGKERQSRRTSDGCLLPKNGSEKLLLENGTYEKPQGAVPRLLSWDKFRGLWAPPDLLTKQEDKAAAIARNKRKLPPSTRRSARFPPEDQTDNISKEQDKNEVSIKKRKSRGELVYNYGERLSDRRTNDGCLVPKSQPFRFSNGRYKRPSGHQPRDMDWDDIRGLWVPKQEENGNESSSSEEATLEETTHHGKYFSHRRNKDGSYFPKSAPFRLPDGTYRKPGGNQPKNLDWDEIRGLWVPEKRNKKRKFGSESSSSSGEDATIIKASKAKLFHHSSSILRNFLQPNKKKRKHGSGNYQSQSFQARTKSNPSGIIRHTINLSNWRKIEKLMRRSSPQKNTGVSPSPAVTTNAYGGEEEVLV